MSPAQLAAVRECTPNYASWSMTARRQLTNRVRVEHAIGNRAFIRSAAITRHRSGVVNELRRDETPPWNAPNGTRTYYLNPDNTVDIVDEWS